MFLEFFESKGHLAMKSFSLVPHNDNSLLIINSGMAPLKPYFTGATLWVFDLLIYNVPSEEDGEELFPYTRGNVKNRPIPNVKDLNVE